MGFILHLHHHFLIILALLFLSFSSSSAASLRYFSEGLEERSKETNEFGLPSHTVDQKRLGGRPGSAPPKCRSKCGTCKPCQAVHIPIQPGLITPLEYYPEAWRCKCGNKIFMP